MEMGKPPMQAAFDGSKEIAFTIRLDDAVARRGVHPGAVHGRHRRPAAARVRGHDRRRDSGLGLRVDQPDADAVQPLPASRRTRSGTAGSTTRSSGCSTRGCGCYDWTLRLTLRFRAGHDGACRSCCSSAPVYLFMHRPEGLPAERGSGPVQWSTPKRRRASASTTWSRHQMQVADIVAKDPNVASYGNVMVGAIGNSGGALNTGPHLRRAEAARRADAVGRSGHRGAAAEAGAGARHPRVHDQPAADQSRRRSGRPARACISSRCRTPTPASCTSARRCMEEKIRAAAGPRGRQQRPAAQEPAGHGRHGPQQGVGARAHRRTRSRTRCTTPTARGRSRRSTRRTISIRSSCRSRRSSRTIRRRCRCSTSARRSGALIPLESVAQAEDRRRTAVGQPLPASCPSVTISFNLKPGLRARRRRRRRFRTRPRPTLPSTVSTTLPGRRAGVPGFAAGPRPDPADGDRRHLHRARASCTRASRTR